MRLVPFDKIEPGMVVAEEVRDRSGRLLLPQGAEITDSALRVMRMWGIAEIAIVGADALPTEADPLQMAVPPEYLEKATEEETPRFAYVNLEEAFYQQLFQLAVEKHARKLLEKGR